jgi:peptidoglycan/xylan/chitin deacetylase (PgdA/CDA1 family)
MTPSPVPSAEHEFFEQSPIAQRPRLLWPDGNRLAVAIVVSLEYYEMQPPADAFIPPNLPGMFGRGPYPDFGSFSRREYGNRIGIFRVMEALDRAAMRATAAIDSSVATRYPNIVAACLERRWEIAAHGQAVTRVISSRMSEDEERRYIRESLDTLEHCIGHRPKGWHGPEYGESHRTPALLAEEGVHYVLDWPNDEQPYLMNTTAGLISVPPALDLEDVHATWHRKLTMGAWRDAVIRALEPLESDGATSGRLLVLNLHPWLIGHPHRITYLDEVLSEINARKSIWRTTAGEIADWYRDNH